MGQGNLAVDRAALHGVASLLTSVAGDLDHGLSGVLAKADGLTWTGDAARVYSQAFATWHQGAAEVMQALKDLARALGTTGDSFADTDSALGANAPTVHTVGTAAGLS